MSQESRGNSQYLKTTILLANVVMYINMNLPKFPHSAMFIGVTAFGKTEFLLQLLETTYKKPF